jgi:hypothetical protein
MIIHWSVLPAGILGTLLFLIVMYLVGSLLSFVSNANQRSIHPLNSSDLFRKLFAGLLFFSSAYAIITTSGQTSLLPGPLLAFFLVKNKANVLSERIPWRTYCFLLVLTLILYTAVFFSKYISLSSEQVSYVAGDTMFYARASEWMNFSQTENVSLDILGQLKEIREPYHYGDLWTAAFIQRLSGIHPMNALVFISYPLLLLIAVTGFWSWMRMHFPGKERLVLLASSFVVFLSGLALLYPKNLIEGDSFSYHLLFYPKLIYPAILISGLALSIKSKRTDLLLLFVTCTAILFISIAPAIIGGAFLVWLFYKLLKAEQFSNPGIPASILTLVSFAWLFFYYYGNTGDATSLSFDPSFAFRIFAGGLLQFFVLAPFAALYVWVLILRKKVTKAFHIPADILYLILLPFSGLLTWAMVYWMSPESVQFFSNPFVICSALLVSWVLAQALYIGNTFTRIIAASLLLFTVLYNSGKSADVETVPAEDLARVRSFIEKHGNGLFATLPDPAAKPTYFSMYPTVYPHFSYIYYYHPHFHNIPLAKTVIPADISPVYKALAEKVTKENAYDVFLARQSKEKTSGEYAYLFIRQYGVRYITVSPNAGLYPELNSQVKDSVQLSGGWKIFSLNP